MTDSAPSPSDQPNDGLQDLDYAELHDRAFDLAQSRRDIGFFVELFNHTAAMNATADEGGSLGEFAGSLLEAVAAAREAFGHHPPEETEPLFRARFVDYIRAHGG